MSSKKARHDEDVTRWDDIPTPNDQRHHTDIFCIFCNTAFVIILFIVCLSVMNLENLRKMTYPCDGEGSLCGYDYPEQPYLYYASPTDPVKRLCVSSCPKEGDTALNCHPTPSLSCQANSNPKYQVTIVDTELVYNRVGLFCLPTDEEERANIQQISQINSKSSVMGFYDAFWSVLGWAALFGFLYLVAMYFFPKMTTRWMFAIGTLFEVIGAILILVVPSGMMVFRIFFFILLLLLAFMSVLTLVKENYRRQLLVLSDLMECAVEAAKNRKRSIAYILLFTFLFFCLIVLVCFEVLCVWSAAKLNFEPQYAFYNISGAGSGFLTVLIFFQFFWGMSFLKEAFNFCVSGYATNWFINHNDKSRLSSTNSLKLLVTKHWGSVIGGSICLGFLYFADLFIDFFVAFTSDRRKESLNVLMSKRILNSSRVAEQNNFSKETKNQEGCGICATVTNLARSESMGYINLIPIPYCNASRYCEWLDDQSCFYDRSQITNRLFRIASHIAIIAISSLIALETNKTPSTTMDFFGVAIVMVISVFTCTYFVCYFSDLAEGLLVSVFLEQHLKREVDDVQDAPEDVRKVYQKDKEDEFSRDNTLGNFFIPKKDD